MVATGGAVRAVAVAAQVVMGRTPVQVAMEVQVFALL
jgi:hypothetical protein